MIYSASRRTDLPAFYPEYVAERVRRSRKLEAIVFWTKDPRALCGPALRPILAKYPTVAQLTITGLGGGPWEPQVPPYGELTAALRELRQALPNGAVIWRFDPIIVTVDLFERFAAVRDWLIENLGPPAEPTVSFVDPYAKAVRRAQRHGLELPQPGAEERRAIIARLQEMAPTELCACCEPELAALPGIRPARCIDGERFDRLFGTKFGALPKDGGQREACGCVRSTDIGSYDQLCGHNCRYCYARPEE